MITTDRTKLVCVRVFLRYLVDCTNVSLYTARGDYTINVDDCE